MAKKVFVFIQAKIEKCSKETNAEIYPVTAPSGSQLRSQFKVDYHYHPTVFTPIAQVVVIVHKV
jgi:hypothetical protein